MTMKDLLPEEELKHWKEIASAHEFDLHRLRYALALIRDSDYSNPWCKAQARGVLDGLDFDEFPETGKPTDDFTRVFTKARGSIDLDADLNSG